MILGAKNVTIDPAKKLPFSSDTGTTGKCPNAFVDACTVARTPPTMRPIDANNPATGPLNAKSNKAVWLGTKDFTGVMVPKKPSFSDGNIVGKPSRIPYLRAETRCASS